VLVPTLRSGDVVLDDLSAHKNPETEDLSIAGVSLRFLQYSPDFNPIEKCGAI